jgi:glutathione S-transferase
MSRILYAHPFSSYCQKALIAFYQGAIEFDYRIIVPDQPEHFAELQSLWPVAKFPLLVDEGRVICEATSIIEHLAAHHPRVSALIPSDPATAVEVRMLDRVFDNYVMTPMNCFVKDALLPVEERDPKAVGAARELLDKIYGWLDRRLGDGEWMTGAGFTLADCAAAPSLFYADWVHPIADSFVRLRSYRSRLLAHPAFARAVDEARPYRRLFPPGAPDRD